MQHLRGTDIKETSFICQDRDSRCFRGGVLSALLSYGIILLTMFVSSVEYEKKNI